ncbi:ATP-binding cassette domain-containing protein [Helicobacter sp. 11S02596-1]|uniref:methionine ABC transporter ATP-binding protein n=1 Tax=Helicobacter sp. 11S02596-1 TaxID=1476194 RepID=UPI000BC5F8B3|nr:ATP-binding cassette domain-containing protein [Helicobacter sp. 11S02596-1]PAF42786.1 methionine ABC transporter ATP-binding protein [Helicobacter sp. 11S02596-1]
MGFCFQSNDKEDGLISLKNIKKTYPNGFCAIKNLDLEVVAGDIMGIIGYSGAGKSTLIRIINRLEEPSEGEIVIDGVDLLSQKPKELQKIRQKMGMIFQHFNLLSSRDVFGNIAFALEIAGWKRENIALRVGELLDLVGLKDKASFYPSQLSGGQKQRVAIARALANHPKILLCDEATSALDTKTTKSILELLKDIQKKFSLTIVLITHQIEVVKEICNQMCVMSGGEIIERGLVHELFANPKHAVTKELISYLPPADDAHIFSHLKDQKNVYKIIFTGENANEPLISDVIKRFGIDANILSGNIEDLATESIGHLIIQFGGEENAILASLEYLNQKGLTIQSFDTATDLERTS